MDNPERQPNTERKPHITRREFLKIITTAVVAAAIHDHPLRAAASNHEENPFSDENPQNTRYRPEGKYLTEDGFSPLSYEDIREILHKIKTEFYKGGQRYSMEPGSNNHCSAFAGQYMRYMGYPMYRFIDRRDYWKNNPRYTIFSGKFPDANTVTQAEMLGELNKALGTDCVTELHLSKAKGMNWKNVTPGSLVYFRVEGQTQHGNNAMQHVAIFMGINKDGDPKFSDFAFGMQKGPNSDRSFEEVAIGVYTRLTYRNSIKPETEPNNQIIIVDVQRLLWAWKKTPEFGQPHS